MSSLLWLVFDLDDTLIDSAQIYKRVYRILRLSKPFHRGRQTAKLLAGAQNPSQHQRLFYFKQMLQQQDRFSVDQLMRLNAAYEAKLAQQVARSVLKSQIRRQLKDLKRHYRLAIFTNESLRTQLIKIQKIDPKGQIFDLILTSEEIGQEKKQKGSYQKLLQLLKARPGQCLMIGDSLEQDIRPARRAGLKALQITRPGDLTPLLKVLPQI